MTLSRRVLWQLPRDHRTVALVFVAPPGLLWLVQSIFSAQPGVFDRGGPAMLGLFPFVLLFVITSIAVLRERTQGTLDRLMATPLGRGDLLARYALAVGLAGVAQAAITLAVGAGLLGLTNRGSPTLTFAPVLGQALLGLALGLLPSAFARTEFQAAQFLPALVLPQIVIPGLLVPVDRPPAGLAPGVRVLPLTYAFDAIDRIMVRGAGIGAGRVVRDLLLIAGGAVACLLADAMTLRRCDD